jgi:hypothetical protein
VKLPTDDLQRFVLQNYLDGVATEIFLPPGATAADATAEYLKVIDPVDGTEIAL